MKLACIGDIHSNYKALEACLNYLDAHHFDGLLFLGDYVSDSPYPLKTVRLLQEAETRFNTWFIRGNREDYLLDYHDTPHEYWKNSSHSGSLLYTYENLDEAALAWFRKMPISRAIQPEAGPSLVICHGSPGKLRENLWPDTAFADDWLQTISHDYLICAHTHKPFIYRNKNKYLINCGSLGLPVNGQIKAQFTSLTFSENIWKRSLISLDYDIDGLIQAFKTSGLQDRASVWSKAVVKLLQTGRNYPLDCLHAAEDLALADNPQIDPRDIPEQYWHKAAKLLGV